MNRSGAVATAVLAGLVLASGAMAAPARDGGGDRRGGDRRGGGIEERMARELELTPDQQKKWDAIGEEQRKIQGPLWEQMMAQLKDLRELVDAKASDDKLTAKLAEVKATRDSIEANRKKYEEQREAILTPVQRAKAALMAARMLRQMMGGGPMGGGHPGGRRGGEGRGGDPDD